MSITSAKQAYHILRHEQNRGKLESFFKSVMAFFSSKRVAAYGAQVRYTPLNSDDTAIELKARRVHERSIDQSPPQSGVGYHAGQDDSGSDNQIDLDSQYRRE